LVNATISSRTDGQNVHSHILLVSSGPGKNHSQLKDGKPLRIPFCVRTERWVLGWSRGGFRVGLV